MADLGGRRRRSLAGEVRWRRHPPGGPRRGGDRAPGRGRRRPDPGEPVLHGRLLTGRGSRRLTARGDAEGAPLWWPTGKIAGEYLPRWLADHGVAAPAAAEPPAGGVTIRRRLRDMRGAEARYLYDLARRFDRDDPPTAALGRRTHATHAR